MESKMYFGKTMGLVVLICGMLFAKSVFAGRRLNPTESFIYRYYYDYNNDYYDYDMNETDNNSLSDNLTNSSHVNFKMTYFDAVEGVLPLVLNICPQYDVAENEDRPQNTSITTPASMQHQSCCSSCSREPDCHLKYGYNRCCPQDENALNNMIEIGCTSTILSSPHRVAEIFLTKYQTMMRCNRRVGSNRGDGTFEDNTMVYSEGVLYSNIRDAECHGVTNYTRWRLYATGCLNDMQTMRKNISPSKLFEKIQNKCMVYSAPPPEFDDSFVRCYEFSELISYCNTSGLWDTYDERVIFLCLYATESITYDTDGNVYFNAFCLACNKPSSYMTTSKTCQKKPLKNNLYIIGDNFHVLLATDEEERSLSEFETKCDPEHVLDIYQDTCRPLLCAFFMAPYKGRCMKLMKDEQPKDITVYLRLTLLDWTQYVHMPNIKWNNSTINNDVILSHVGLLNNCSVIESFLLGFSSARTNFAGFYNYAMRFRFTKMCFDSLSNIANNTQIWSIHNFPLRANSKIVDVNLQLTIPINPNITGLNVVNITDDLHVTCYGCLNKFSFPFHCPMVKLTPSDLCHIYRTSNLSGDCSEMYTSDMFKEKILLGDDLVNAVIVRVFYMCVQDYNKLSTLMKDKFDNIAQPMISSNPQILTPETTRVITFISIWTVVLILMCS